AADASRRGLTQRMKASDILKLTADRGRRVCNHDGDCGQIRQPAVQVRLGGGTGTTSVTTRQPSRAVSRTPRTSGRSGRSRVQLEIWRISRIRGRTYVAAQLSKASNLGNPN